MKGFCPVTYLEGKQRYIFTFNWLLYHLIFSVLFSKTHSLVHRYEALVRGKIEYAAEYMQKIYVFDTDQKRHKFMRFGYLCMFLIFDSL